MADDDEPREAPPSRREPARPSRGEPDAAPAPRHAVGACRGDGGRHDRVGDGASAPRRHGNRVRPLDEIKAELTAFRAETGKSLRRLEGGMIAAEGQNIQRQADIIEAANRIADVERSLPASGEWASGVRTARLRATSGIRA